MIKTPNETKKAGFRALSKELGAAGMIRFLLQFDIGEGDYSKERKKILDSVDLKEVKEFVNKP